MDIVLKRVERHYPQKMDRKRAFLISACATARAHACDVLAYNIGHRSSREVCKVLNVDPGKMSMTSDEMASLLGCSTEACNHEVMNGLTRNHPHVSALLGRIQDSLSVTLQSEQSTRMWSMPSVRAVVAFATYLDMSEVILEKLLGTISKSDLRRLEEVIDTVQSDMDRNDIHLNSLNAIIQAFSQSIRV